MFKDLESFENQVGYKLLSPPELLCTRYYKDGSKEEQYHPALFIFYRKTLHRENGPAIEFVKEENKKYNRYYIDGIYAPNYIINRILNYKKRKTLLPYLLDDNNCIRFFAEQRLKELENE